MVNIISSEQIERSAIFDSCVESAIKALRLDSVKQTFGKDADYLHAALEQTFLPNIESGNVSVPRFIQDTNAIAFLPLLNPFEELRVTESLMKPTPQKVKKVIDVLGIHNSQLPSYDTGWNIPTVPENAYATTLAPRVMVQGLRGYLVMSARPCILTKNLLNTSRYQRIGTMVHEMVHATDFEALTLITPDRRDVKRDKLFRASLELRAHHVSYHVLKVIGHNLSPSDGSTCGEILWQKFKLDSSQGLHINEEIADDVIKSGLMT